jgi:hypothetical protein
MGYGEPDVIEGLLLVGMLVVALVAWVALSAPLPRVASLQDSKCGWRLQQKCPATGINWARPQEVAQP